jgi:predicted aspartyl protease
MYRSSRGLLATLAFGALCGGASGSDRPPDETITGTSALSAVDDARDVVPTTPDRIGRILAQVMVNGQGPYRFMVDTGANHTALSASMLSRLGLSPDQGVLITVIGIVGSQTTASVHLDSVDAGLLHMRDVQIPVLAGPVLADIDGILGSDGLTDKTVTADFAHDRLTISRGVGGVPIADVVVPGHLISQRLLRIDCRIGGVSAKAVIDTGSPRSLANFALLNALLRRSRESASSAPTGVVDATEASQAAVIRPVPSLQFGTASVDNLYLTFGNFRIFKDWGLENQPAVLVGMDVLGTFAEITIDYRRQEFGVYPKADMISYR